MERPESPSYKSRASAWIGALSVVATVVTAGWLFAGAPQLSRAPGWFYQWLDKGSLDMLLVAASTALLPVVVRTSFRWVRSRFWLAAGCVVVGSILVQLAAGVVARRDVRGWTDRFYVGHGEFTARTKTTPDALYLLRNYEQLAQQRQLGLYGPSKPPGTYAVYLLIDRTSRWPLVQALIGPLISIVARDPGIWPEDRPRITWTIVVLCLCAAFTALPLCWLARALFPGVGADERALLYPAWLFVSAPAINVITVHLDSSVFPLLSATSTALCAASVRAGTARARGLLAAAGGGCGMFAVYCSYGNLPIFVMGAAVVLGMALSQASWRAAILPLLAAGAGALSVLLLLRVALNWQPLVGYARGVAYHVQWRPNLPHAWRYGLAFLEFSLFAGPPLMLAFIASTLLALRDVKAVSGLRVLTLVAAALIVGISLAFGTPEAARLWLFMLPWICCAVGAIFARSESRGAFGMLLAGQLVLVLFVKNYLVW
ncbi:MAG TPA: hypothetical protein VJV78_24700 [Polyangiales bacterium]|nr:hypothetical protein [Polyangiales bacterium]